MIMSVTVTGRVEQLSRCAWRSIAGAGTAPGSLRAHRDHPDTATSDCERNLSSLRSPKTLMFARSFNFAVLAVQRVPGRRDDLNPARVAT